MKIFLSLFFCLLFSVTSLFAQHLKKDGTPDMRYKESKSTYIPPSSPSKSNSTFLNSGTHLKKDGTPDKRYKQGISQYSQPKYSSSLSKSKTYNNYPAERDKDGKLKRSESQKHAFMKQSGYPKGRPGYVVDHVVPLKKGGCDCPANMQWQTIKAAKEKDKWE
jgi:hypothetical protein